MLLEIELLLLELKLLCLGGDQDTELEPLLLELELLIFGQE